MRAVIFAAVLAFAAATVIKDDYTNSVLIGKESLVNVDVRIRQNLCMKLLNFIMQPTVYEDIRDVAREWTLEDNMDKYLKVEVVNRFCQMFKMGLLPRGEVFVHTNELHIKEAIAAFRLMYFAKDFDTFIRTACYLRERINGGMFVYAFTCAVFHRQDCQGITLPAPYEIYPYFFVDSDIINKAFMLKMTKAANDPVIFDYYGIKVSDRNLVVIDWRKGLRHTMSEDDRISYFTEDIDLNTYMYYLHMSYPYWMSDEVYNVNKERRGEVFSYGLQQLLARYRLERLGRGMCDIQMLRWDEPLKFGYWPKIRLPTGDEMPVRSNNVLLVNENNMKYKLLIDDIEKLLRDGIMTGRIELRDGTIINLRKAEDFENFCRLILGDLGFYNDDAKVYNLVNLWKKLVAYSNYNFDKYTYVPTALDMYSTCLRDPLYWRILKRVSNTVVLYKNLLPKYTFEELDFPGVKVEKIVTDKLVTFMDQYDLDITNALYLDNAEMLKKKSDLTYIARMRRLNNQPFKVTIDVMSDKAVDSVVRVFLGPKFDCMGRLINLVDKRLDMVEIDSFLYKLETGKNTIVRNSLEMHGVINDRVMTSRVMDHSMDTTTGVLEKVLDSNWYRTRLGMSHRLLLPLGTRGGLALQLYVIITPVRTGLLQSNLDMNLMKDRHVCRWTTCIDTMPLGFPFDRNIDVTTFFTNNMKFSDIFVYRKDMFLANNVKDIDISDMILKRDDLTFLDTDKLVRWSYKDVMLMSVDHMTRM